MSEVNRTGGGAYLLEINDVAGLREYGITPTRVRAMNDAMKKAAPTMNFKFLNSNTEGRWEASRDGLHFHGTCPSGKEDCGGVYKYFIFDLGLIP
jgi:hypothetical protein